MNRKRMITLLALVVIIAALIVPGLLPQGKHTSFNSSAGKTISHVKSEQLNLGATDDRQEKNATQTNDSVVAGAEDQQKASHSGQAVAPADNPVSNSSEAKGYQVGIAVVGKSGKLLYSPANVTIAADNKWGITALGALDASGLDYAMKPAWPDFVDSIDGQTCQGVSGWMYMVNGEIPMHLADKHPVKEGDQVIWWYSESMDQAPPVWDELVKKQH